MKNRNIEQVVGLMNYCTTLINRGKIKMPKKQKFTSEHEYIENKEDEIIEYLIKILTDKYIEIEAQKELTSDEGETELQKEIWKFLNIIGKIELKKMK